MKLNIIGVLFAAGVGLAVASPAEAQEPDKGQLTALSGNNGPDDAVWVLPALVIAGFAAGYGVRSLVSSVRQRRARALRYGSLTSDRQLKADNLQISRVPGDDVGDPQSPQHPRIVT
jgi:hypothetical protein